MSFSVWRHTPSLYPQATKGRSVGFGAKFSTSSFLVPALELPGSGRVLPRSIAIPTLHKNPGVLKAYLAKHPEIMAETLPAYAPEINPDENVWSWAY